MPEARAIALPVISPTSNPPISPGPLVAAMASISFKRHAGAHQRLLDQRIERIDMGARRDLRHDPAIGAVFFQLAQHHIGQNPARAVGHHARRPKRRFRRSLFRCREYEGGADMGPFTLKIAIAGKAVYTELR